LHPSGCFLASWIETARGERKPAGPGELVRASDKFLRAQAFDANAQPIGPPFSVDTEGARTPVSFPAALVALREERGYAIAWVRADEGSGNAAATLLARRVSLSGELLGEPRTVADGPRLRNPAMATLDNGRVAIAWDAQPAPGSRRVRARVLGEGLELDGRSIEFETMHQASDWDPAVAAAPDGGFALAWVTGEGPERDVFARTFDGQGHPTTRPLALSTRLGAQTAPTLARLSDGSWVAAWQDDLSFNTCIAARRFYFRPSELGPMVRLSGRWPGDGVHDLSPRLAAVPGSDGAFLAVWSHGTERRGKDVGLCRFARGFDATEGR
jgi:hypothetical protein